MTVKNGAVSWTDSSGNKKGKDEYLRLNPGNNLLRLMTEPHQYHQHRYEPEGGKKYGYRINCSRSETVDDCPLCELGNKAKRRWFVGVIDRKTGTYKTLDIGYAVFKSIQTLAQSAWGAPNKYDVDIIVDPQGGATGYYYVSPMPPVPLSAEDMRLQEENPIKNLEMKVVPPSPKVVKEKLDKIQEELGTSSSSSSAGNSGPTSDKDGETDEEEGENFFKNYAKKSAAG